jgi:hypothetical protein
VEVQFLLASPCPPAIHEPTARACIYNACDGSISVIATIDALVADGFELVNMAARSSSVP